MKEVILCYQGEMALKGLNKATFEAALAKALRFRVRELGKFQVYKAQSTMYVEPRDEEAAANFDGRSSTNEAGPAKRNVHMVTVMEP